MTNAVFEEPPVPVAPIAVEDLIGEGRKYQDVDTALKALPHAQAHIARLEQEARELRATLDANARFEELVRQQQNQNPAPPKEEPPVAAPAQEDLATLVRKVAQEDREKERVDSNVLEVTNEMIRLYGDSEKANQVVALKARELGVSVAFLQEVAAKSPKAFFAQIGVNASPQGSPAPAQGNVNIPAGSPSGANKPGSYSYYKELKRQNPSLYFAPKTQLEMHNAALKHGSGWTET